ncbi:hypothetical protein [Streptomyces fagopyri]|uniref:hypothetical protein n=1 Tax=Streptomyces fagopyri TaxID=2662397 RepID=UPI00371A6D48
MHDSAVPASDQTGGSGEFVLPTYVLRAHDRLLRARLAAAIDDAAAPTLLVIRGGSCTGKTRTAFEAVRATVPDDFQLLAPADAQGLHAVLEADAIGPRTVLWLNEAQNYLTGQHGEAVAAALLRRLDGAGPLIMQATLWPEYEKALTSAPTPGNTDPHRHARDLLAQAARVDVPPNFADDLRAVSVAADGGDSSLAIAAVAGSVEITQALAAGPDLIDDYEHPVGLTGAWARALVSTAMDAHRLGATSSLPHAFLKAAAPGYLTEQERAAAHADWFDDALARARALVKRTTSALQDVPHSTGMGPLPGVVKLADYLQQYGRRTRWFLCPRLRSGRPQQNTCLREQI